MNDFAFLKNASVANYNGLMTIDIASSAIGTTATSGIVTPGKVPFVGIQSQSFNVIVTAVSGTNPTMDVAVEESLDNGTNWVRIYEFQRITAAGAYTSPAIRSQFGTRFRYVQTIGGTNTPSFTRAINRIQFAHPGMFVRQFVDRSITDTSLNSTTPITGIAVGGYNVDGATTLQLTVNMGTIATTAPQFMMEGSEDGATWYSLSTALTSVASSSVSQVISTYIPKFARVRVSTAGVGSVLGYVSLKAFGK